MNTIETKAYAKLNLTLDITGRRADGYHDLDMVMISCGLHDVIRIHLDTGKPWQLRSNRPELSDGPNDLTWRAAETYFARTGISCTGLTLSLEKRIPAGAGLGGGSSDAAAVLHALNRFYGCPLSLQALCEIGLQLGADVPYCLVRGTQRALGKGERLTPLPPMPDCWILLCKPEVSFPTPELFRAVDARNDIPHPDCRAMAEAICTQDLKQIGRLLGNSFLPVALERAPEVGSLLQQIQSCGALGATMTGSGSSVFGLFADRNAAEKCGALLSKCHCQVFLTRPV